MAVSRSSYSPNGCRVAFFSGAQFETKKHRTAANAVSGGVCLFRWQLESQASIDRQIRPSIDGLSSPVEALVLCTDFAVESIKNNKQQPFQPVPWVRRVLLRIGNFLLKRLGWNVPISQRHVRLLVYCP
jgi:hypothetical protein